jgi:hypothetical protein
MTARRASRHACAKGEVGLSRAKVTPLWGPRRFASPPLLALIPPNVWRNSPKSLICETISSPSTARPGILSSCSPPTGSRPGSSYGDPWCARGRSPPALPGAGGLHQGSYGWNAGGEAGDLIQAEHAGAFGWEDATQLEDALLWSDNPGGTIVFKSVGHALWDLAAARTAIGF